MRHGKRTVFFGQEARLGTDFQSARMRRRKERNTGGSERTSKEELRERREREEAGGQGKWRRGCSNLFPHLKDGGRGKNGENEREGN